LSEEREASLESRLLGEQVALLHHQSRILFVGSGASTLLLVWLLWDEPAGRAHLLAWFVSVMAVLALRQIGVVCYDADTARMRRGLFWGWAFTLGAAASGIVWGYLGWAFFQPNLFFLFPIALMMAGQTALSVPTVGMFVPAHIAFNVFSMTPFMLRNFLEEGQLFFGQSLAILLFMIVCVVFAFRQQSMIREAIQLRFSNIDLLNGLTLAKEKAEEANAAKSRFLAAASHDLRQPLQAISLFTHAVAQDVGGGRLPEVALLGKLQSSCDSLESLLDSLLDLSRAEAGSQPLNVADISLQPIFERIEREFTDQAQAKKLRLRVVPAERVVRSDPILLERILRNLVANALRYTEHGAILVGCRQRGGRLRIEVRDSGIGIPQHLHGDIFHDFYQLGNPERDRRKGLGLGLAIVRALAIQLGHGIDLRSAPAAGTTFTITLDAGTTPPSLRQAPAVSPDRLRGRLVAIIDDEAPIREALSDLLARWHCATATGEDANEVLAALAGRVPDAIIADRRLRGGRLGTREIARLRKRFGPVPALLVTGDTAPGTANDAPFRLLHKPVQGFRLRAELDALLRSTAS